MNKWVFTLCLRTLCSPKCWKTFETGLIQNRLSISGIFLNLYYYYSCRTFSFCIDSKTSISHHFSNDSSSTWWGARPLLTPFRRQCLEEMHTMSPALWKDSFVVVFFLPRVHHSSQSRYTDRLLQIVLLYASFKEFNLKASVITCKWIWLKAVITW